MSEHVDETHLAAWRALLKTHATVIDRIEKDLAQAERLPLTSYDVLIELAEAPGRRLRMHELADRVVLSRSGLTRLVDRLEAEELLTRERSGADRRGAYAVLTEKGLRALREAWPIYARGINQYFARHLSPEEAKVLAEALARIAETRA